VYQAPEYNALANDPEAWLRYAERQEYLTQVLRDAFMRAYDSVDSPIHYHMALFEGWMFHLGMWIELTAKAALARAGRNAGAVNHHQIPNAIESIIGPLKESERETLERFADAVRWWGRYPVPKTLKQYERRKEERRYNMSADDVIVDEIIRKLKAQGG
jgi:hypothetical protein